MGWMESYFKAWADSFGAVLGPFHHKSHDDKNDEEKRKTAYKVLAGEAILLTGLSLAPAAYASLVGRKRAKKGPFTEKQRIVGSALENSATQTNGVLMTALASPAIATAMAYITVQMLEDAGIIKKGLGDAAQGLLTVAAAGPMISGIGQLASSAFTKAPKITNTMISAVKR